MVCTRGWGEMSERYWMLRVMPRLEVVTVRLRLYGES